MRYRSFRHFDALHKNAQNRYKPIQLIFPSETCIMISYTDLTT
jgi:hypothetical protein